MAGGAGRGAGRGDAAVGDSLTLRHALARLRGLASARETRTIVIALREAIHRAIAALQYGADDCLAAPFTREELVARVNTNLQRPSTVPGNATVRIGPVLLDKIAHCIFVHREVVDLAPAEYRLMALFLENDGRVFSCEELLRRVRHIRARPRIVDVHVRRARQVLARRL